MKRSQLRSLQARSADAAIGRMKESDLWAATNAPDANIPAGPRGPSGRIATSCPAISSRTIEIIAEGIRRARHELSVAMLADQDEHTLASMVPEQWQQVPMPESEDERALRPAQIEQISLIHYANPPG